MNSLFTSLSLFFFLSLPFLPWGVIDGGEAESSVRYMNSLTNATQQDLIAQKLIDSYGLTEVEGIFLRQNSSYTPPYRIAGQLPNFAATIPWSSVMDILNSDDSNRLVYCIRHGRAWENDSPSNKACSWEDGDVARPVFDSPLDFHGVKETISLNRLFRVPANNSDGVTTWYDALNFISSVRLSSPITRAMQTTTDIFLDLAEKGAQVTVSDLLRAGLNGDKCNYRRPISKPSTTVALPAPWNTECDYTNNSLTTLWRGGTFVQLRQADMGLAEIWKDFSFQFIVRPAGASYPGIQSDVDEQWRSDYIESNLQRSARMGALLVQIFQAYPTHKIFSVTTHSEICQALNRLLTGTGYSQANVEVSPFMIQAPWLK
mmetsp:Transcript_5538/g.8372  ORF Transcript_5538/g.8372 Transcript_5538/m.8372 type:complete len:374 (-) Transcript_5538:101-1222(-)